MLTSISVPSHPRLSDWKKAETHTPASAREARMTTTRGWGSRIVFSNAGPTITLSQLSHRGKDQGKGCRTLRVS